MSLSHATPGSSSLSPFSRRGFLRAGVAGGVGLGAVQAWQAQAAAAGETVRPAKSVIYLFLTGGASQHDTFDMKPEGPVEFKGEFNPIATRTPGVHICEHLPMLAERSQHWSLVRSLTHTNNGHDTATYLMLTGKSVLPNTFQANRPQVTDLPSIAAISGYATAVRNNMPRAAILPEKIYHSNSGVYPGQFAGLLGSQYEPWLIEATDKPHAYHSYSGAFPTYLFDLHKGELSDKLNWRFEVPNLTLPAGVVEPRFQERMKLLNVVEQQLGPQTGGTSVAGFNRMRESALSLMADPKMRAAIEVRKSDPKTLERYGDNSFGWSLLMARRLVEAGVNMVQVNMGNFGSWDLHGNNYPCLKNFLFPPTDRAVSALLDDLHESGMLDDTLIIMAGEFGRTPRITHIAQNIYKTAGRDHWGPLQTVWLAGGGIKGGRVVGTSDKAGAYPASDAQTVESFAATIYQALGIPREAVWHDVTGRPHSVYESDPMPGLT